MAGNNPWHVSTLFEPQFGESQEEFAIRHSANVAATRIQTLWRRVAANRVLANLLARMVIVQNLRQARKFLKNEVSQGKAYQKQMVHCRNRRVTALRKKLSEQPKFFGIFTSPEYDKLKKRIRHKQMSRRHWQRASIIVQSVWRGCVVRRRVLPALLGQAALHAWRTGDKVASLPVAIDAWLARRRSLVAGKDHAVLYVLRRDAATRLCQAWRRHSAWKRMRTVLKRHRALGLSADALHDLVNACISGPGLVASRAAEAPVDLQHDHTCPVCYGLLFRPVRTSCGHTFCKYCLVLWVETASTRRLRDLAEMPRLGNEPMSASCPSCREDIVISGIMNIDRNLEDKIIATYGTECYNARYREIVKEKVDRLVDHSGAEQVEEMNFLEHQAQDIELVLQERWHLIAGHMAFSFVLGGPLGLAASAVGFGSAALYPMARHALEQVRGTERFRYGILEDESESRIQGSIKLMNMTMTPVIAHLRQMRDDGTRGTRISSIEVDASSPVTFLLPDWARPTRPAWLPEAEALDQETYMLEVGRPLAIIERELASSVVAAGRSYLLCCTDASVQSMGTLVTTEANDKAPVQVTNLDRKPTKLAFFECNDKLCWFPYATLELEPGSCKEARPDVPHLAFKVVIWVPKDEGGGDEELASVEMRRGQAYGVKDARRRIAPVQREMMPFEFEDDSDDEVQEGQTPFQGQLGAVRPSPRGGYSNR